VLKCRKVLTLSFYFHESYRVLARAIGPSAEQSYRG